MLVGTSKKKAVCIRCGAYKKSAFAKCPNCDLIPKTDFEAARALILSEKTLFGETEIGRSIEELEEISNSIKRGRPYPIDGEEQKMVVRAYWEFLKSQPPPRNKLQKYFLWGGLTILSLIIIGTLIWWLW